MRIMNNTKSQKLIALKLKNEKYLQIYNYNVIHS